jgi:hypothetical protein
MVKTPKEGDHDSRQQQKGLGDATAAQQQHAKLQGLTFLLGVIDYEIMTSEMRAFLTSKGELLLIFRWSVVVGSL